MKLISIAVLGDQFISWMGGANFIGSITRSIIDASSLQRAEISVLIGAHHLSPDYQAGFETFEIIKRGQITGNGPLGCLLSYLPDDTAIVFYKDLNKTITELAFNIIAPTGLNLGKNFPIPWLAYIPDFQHQYIPHLFSQEERSQRDQAFRLLLENSHGTYVNSASVARDVARFYGNSTSKKRVLIFPPVFPTLKQIEKDFILACLQKYGVKQPYLISCSQRWMHKNHETIIYGLDRYLKKYPNSAVSLVFTGDKSDYRNPDYQLSIERIITDLGISSSIYDLGLIDRNEQLALINGALALVSASSFEGGPGASGVMEAALFGVPAITANLDVNREMAIGAIHFFEGNDPESLSGSIESVVNQYIQKIEPHLTDEHIGLLNSASGLRMITLMRSMIEADTINGSS